MRRKIICIIACVFFLCPHCLAQKVYTKVETDKKEIALTFDDGPHPYKTEKILNVLQKYGIKATFFVIGENVETYPGAFEKLCQSGNEIGNHTLNHQLLIHCSENEIEKEIKDTEGLIRKYSDKEISLIRPPCGVYDETLIKYCEENEKEIILWNIDTLDWNHASVASILKKASNVKNGDIILFHDYTSGENHTLEALERLIPKLLDEGFEFVTVGQLLQDRKE